ncbi:AAA family ATPase [Pseudoalteromonas arctica]|uniref:AAA family ATPase n=1 Tax=Pseudoalteromonas arctica TaxID=394751 RepID=A0ABU9TC28_9GAMM
MFKKIKSITNMAVYKSFDWDRTVKEPNNRIAEFKSVNIIYGRNYSGKTTLSRVFRACETGVISDKYTNPSFSIELDDGTEFNNENTPFAGAKVRVFNEDFVRDNLNFISNPDEGISSFAILGDDNNRIEKAIEAKELEVGSFEENTGLNAVKKQESQSYFKAKGAVSAAESSLESKIKDKANKKGTGIKHNALYGEANYNAVKLNRDIQVVIKPSYVQLTESEVHEKTTLLKEDTKPSIPSFTSLNLNYANLQVKTQEAIERKISMANPIKKLVENNILENWVRNGRLQHEGKRSTCGFCGSLLSPDLYKTLDNHFNKESEELRINLEKLIKEIDQEITNIPIFLSIDNNLFYSTYRTKLDEIKEQFRINSLQYIENLKHYKKVLKKRLTDIFKPIEFIEKKDVSSLIETALVELQETITSSNEFTNSLSSKKLKAKENLRLNEVYLFLQNIKYQDELKKISDLKTTEAVCVKSNAEAHSEVKRVEDEIRALKSELKDETKGADRVNEYLNDFFGHKEISLSSIESADGYRFEVIRHGIKAHHLSEGECSLVAFCYFMAKLEDIDTKGEKPIVYIDDPISSLDNNHIFFVFGLINSEIVNSGAFSQLFISTHNLDFLKYLKRLLPRDINGNDLERRYFIVERNEQESNIRLMPKYLKSYVTEFNYLFHQVFKCANAPDIAASDEHDCYYNYANSARKFLEAFLYFKYPNANEKDQSKLVKFFGGDVRSKILIERITNEYSHLAGVFERSITPVEIPEMKTSAQFILNKINEKDPEQYNSLLESIGNPEVHF